MTQEVRDDLFDDVGKNLKSHQVVFKPEQIERLRQVAVANMADPAKVEKLTQDLEEAIKNKESGEAIWGIISEALGFMPVVGMFL